MQFTKKCLHQLDLYWQYRLNNRVLHTHSWLSCTSMRSSRRLLGRRVKGPSTPLYSVPSESSSLGFTLYSAGMYCNVQDCTVLYMFVLYCTCLYCTVQVCTVVYRFVLYCTCLYQYCTGLYQYCTGLYCTVQVCTVLYRQILYCTGRYFSVQAGNVDITVF